MFRSQCTLYPPNLFRLFGKIFSITQSTGGNGLDLFFKDLFLFLCVYVCKCTTHALAAPDFRRGCYREFLAASWVLGTEPGPLEELYCS